MTKTNNLKVLVACEESQVVTKEFRKLGHEAYSCDVVDCTGGHPEWHIKDDVINHINKDWDMMIAHPPCTYLSISGSRWLYNKDGSRNEDRWEKRELALDFVRILLNAPITHIALENPVSVISSQIRKPDNVIEPYQFGHGETKRTCLWLKNLPNLMPTNIVEGRETKIWNGMRDETGKKLAWNSKEIKTARSKTYKGIAEAIANQWSKYALNYRASLLFFILLSACAKDNDRCITYKVEQYQRGETICNEGICEDTYITEIFCSYYENRKIN